MLVAFSLLAISLSYLLFKHPPSSWAAYLRQSDTQPAEPKPSQTPTEEPGLDTREQPNNESPIQKSNSPSPEGTPKAAPGDSANGVPTFTLAAHESSEEDEEDNLPPPSFPALNSAQRASAPSPAVSMAPPPKPVSMAPPARPASSLMPPPTLKASNLRALPTPSPSLRVPATGPAPNRGPVPNRGLPTSNGGLMPTATVKTPNARGKVLLSPGHSPLDWANLQRSSKNLSGVPSLLRVTPSMLKEHNGRKGKPAWSSYEGKVYNITPYLPFHPGGEGELRRAAGKDGRKLFMEVHPWVNWDNMLGECLVGIMVAEEQARPASSLEDMD
ncbi:hypothetical protein BU23DRAFT_114292 [Bimuria novae-zelandiae CBS 107.79]|uniref:Cytochrome b5 heme-binding domain-containing protein n=1 Tax=Bimuria novae-zelandiae CBS 107.79 TaxID=1447943 RepID=A0A6A5VAX9_9PLEO|nr:hypothetical protein BU23DRAFT_114292 [Bimuria novae-zelandiae CBS 107.79]